MARPETAARLLGGLFEDEAQEVFGVLMLDGKHQLVAYQEVSRGTLTSSLVHPREVFGAALRVGSVAALIVGHNHPSGLVDPSPEDCAVTERLIHAGELLGVPVLDHVIVGGSGAWVSLRTLGLGGF
ncbi:MAG: DNA repair protein RadC [bacterium]|nr:DNA repair protein RadC [bacterium]